MSNMRSGDVVTKGQVLAKVTTPTGQTEEVRSPIDAVVAAVYATDGSTVHPLQDIVVLAPDKEARVVSSLPPSGVASQLRAGQRAVAQVVGCPALVTTIAHVALLPITTEAAVERVGEQGVVDAVMPGATGVPVLADVPDSWCPSLRAGAVATMTVTIGSAHPISYVSP